MPIPEQLRAEQFEVVTGRQLEVAQQAPGDSSEIQGETPAEPAEPVDSVPGVAG